MNKTTPDYAKIETIRSYELIPEKAYRWKLLIIFLFDLYFIFITFYSVYLKEFKESWDIDLINRYSNRFFAVFYEITGTSPMENVGHVLGFILRILGYFVVFFIIPYLAMKIMGYLLSLIGHIFNGVIKLFGILNPFNHNKGENKKSDALIEFDEKRAQEKAERRKKSKKLQPFLDFKENSLGAILMPYLVFLRVIAHISFHVNDLKYPFIRLRNEVFIYKVFIWIYILNIIVIFLLRKEPRRSREIAEAKLKKSFAYYCEPARRARLSPSEKLDFDSNFKWHVSYDSYHRKGHFKDGIYHNQEFTYEATLSIEDLITGFDYWLKYRTDRYYKNWDCVSGREAVTIRGRYNVRR